METENANAKASAKARTTGSTVKFTVELFLLTDWRYPMVVLLKQNPDPRQIEHLINWLNSLGLDTHISKGAHQTIIGLVGDTTCIDIDVIKALDIVADVKRIQEPFKNANRKFHPADTIIDIGGVKIGGGHFQVIAGPCSVESAVQICSIAQSVQKAGANILRGGAFKPRTSPYAFQGLHEEGIEFLLKAKRETGMPIITEVMDAATLPLFEEVDILQIGARNMQNYELLKQVGMLRKPVLLKRGLANTLQELLMSAEYIMAGGNKDVILCERGIRTFETYTRNTLDLSAVPVLRGLTHLPIVVDPSHATGSAALVKPLALAAAVAGADGLLIEVHNDPAHALSDGPQSLTPEVFSDLMSKLKNVLPFRERE
jgi:3-deoxy-7-phosphoheptulonate synthase